MRRIKEAAMFLHIGGDVVVPTKNVIAILDIETSTISRDTGNFLKLRKKRDLLPRLLTISRGRSL